MKQFIFLMVLALVISCKCQETQVHLVWDQYEANAEATEYFIAYMWEGDDTTQCVFSEDTILDTVYQDLGISEFSVPTYVSDGKIIRGACVAYDSLSRGSEWSYTEYYYPPDIPRNLRVEP